MFSFLLRLSTILIYSLSLSTAKTALLFGGSGAVGSETLRALVRNPFWEEIILVGRQSTGAKVKDVLLDEGVNPETSRVTLKILPDLSNVDTDESLHRIKADACIIALGVGSPHKGNLREWHSIEVEMISSIARLCNKIQVRYLSLLSSSDSQIDPKPFSKEELDKSSDSPLGWMGMVKHYFRIKGLEDLEVTTSLEQIANIRLFQPSSIITEQTRYGWVDSAIFKLHKIFDPILPSKYHSVKVELLGTAFAEDAVQILSSTAEDSEIDTDSKVTRLYYKDFVKINEAKSKHQNQESDQKAKFDDNEL